MTVLKIEGLEKRNADTLVFPSFDLVVGASEAVAIHCHMNIREVLIQLFEGPGIPSQGTVSVNGIQFTESRFTVETGVCLLNEGYYERLTVRDHLSFFRGIYSSDLSIEEAARILRLKEKYDYPLRKCSISEVKRVQFSRMLFADPKLAVFEEPLQNTDLETHRIFMDLVQHLTSRGKAVLMLTGNMESALTVTDRVYRLGQDGLHRYEIENSAEEELREIETDVEEIPKPVRFEKIPAKFNEKILLFSPMEIDFIESADGGANIMVEGDRYPSDFKMNELEDRLLPYGFFRCHRSYIVNLQRVREVITWTRNSYSLVLDDRTKTNIPLSKTKMAELKAIIGLK